VNQRQDINLISRYAPHVVGEVAATAQRGCHAASR